MTKTKKFPKPSYSPGKPLAFAVRGSSEWRQWVQALAEFDRATVADVVDRAVAAHARKIGFSPKPPER
jgi:hypothetical protein